MLLLDPASVWRVATAWYPATRVAFRFFATYFTLYVLTTQMLPTAPLPCLDRLE